MTGPWSYSAESPTAREHRAQLNAVRGALDAWEALGDTPITTGQAAATIRRILGDRPKTTTSTSTRGDDL